MAYATATSSLSHATSSSFHGEPLFCSSSSLLNRNHHFHLPSKNVNFTKQLVIYAKKLSGLEEALRIKSEHAEKFGYGVLDRFVGHGIETLSHSEPLIYHHQFSEKLLNGGDFTIGRGGVLSLSAFSCGSIFWSLGQVATASEGVRVNVVYEVGEIFELGIQLTYLLLLLALLGVGSFFVIRQVLVRRELDLSAKELQEQVRSGDASATELFELGAVMLRRKFYPAATKYLLQAVEKWDGDDQDLAQVYNALGVSYTLDGKTEKGIAQFENAVKLQPGYVTAWNNLGDAYEKTKDLTSALKAFEEVLLFDPNNKVARPRRDALKDKVKMYKGVPLKSKK